MSKDDHRDRVDEMSSGFTAGGRAWVMTHDAGLRLVVVGKYDDSAIVRALFYFDDMMYPVSNHRTIILLAE